VLGRRNETEDSHKPGTGASANRSPSAICMMQPCTAKALAAPGGRCGRHALKLGNSSWPVGRFDPFTDVVIFSLPEQTRTAIFWDLRSTRSRGSHRWPMCPRMQHHCTATPRSSRYGRSAELLCTASPTSLHALTTAVSMYGTTASLSCLSFTVGSTTGVLHSGAMAGMTICAMSRERNW
jgi:hypothetical protein